MKVFRISSSLICCKWILLVVIFVSPGVAAFSTPSSYLDSLNQAGDASSEPGDERVVDDSSASTPFGMPDEEYYGHTNPMANNWPGSKHQEYGGYLKLLGDTNKNSSKDQEHCEEASPDEWYGKSNPMASWQGYRHPKFGGYLDNLQSPAANTSGGQQGPSSTAGGTDSSTFPPQKPSDYGNDVRWGAEVYLKSIQKDDDDDDDDDGDDEAAEKSSR